MIRSAGQRFTVAEFERLLELPENEDRRLELIDGEIVETSLQVIHGIVASTLAGEIHRYLITHPIGQAMISVDHFLPDDLYNTRRPNLSFINRERMQTLNYNTNAPLMPDLAVEVKSPSNYYTGREGLRQKAEYDLAHGSRLVWLVDPDSLTVEVYRPNAAVETLTLDDTLNGGDVLPGFSLPLRQIFPV